MTILSLNKKILQWVQHMLKPAPNLRPSFWTSFWPSFWPSFWGGGGNYARLASVLFAVTGLVFGIATYLVLSDLTPIRPTAQIVWPLLSLNLFVMMGLVILISWQLLALRRARREKRVGAVLHNRLIVLFALIAVIPALLVAIFASVTLESGLDSWFSQRTKTIISNSTEVANAYLTEHRASLQRDSLIMARDLNRANKIWQTNRPRFINILQAQANIRALPQALLIHRNGTVAAAASDDRAILSARPSDAAFAAADKTPEPIILQVGNMAQVHAMIRLENIEGLYLYTTRFVNPKVIDHLVRTKRAAREYGFVETHRYETQITFALIYVILTLVILLSAIWYGLTIADYLVAPIRRLTGVAKKLGEGDWAARIEKNILSNDEIGQLAQTFNIMADRLSEQQQELIDAHNNLDDRASFTEKVLGGVSSGVIGVDINGCINHINKAACELFGLHEKTALKQSLAALVPQLNEIIISAHRAENKRPRKQLSFTDNSGEQHTILVSAVWAGQSPNHGIIITFDDLTEMLATQRNATWADIARRIAHEIKNPLTPIQLSAERILSKYGKQQKDENELLHECVGTIIRQVEDIGRMVDEFAAFARMPKAVAKVFDVADIVARSVFLQRIASPDLKFSFTHPGATSMLGDQRLLSQAMTNGLKNAVESIRSVSDEDKLSQHHIDIEITKSEDELRIAIHDSGLGWPKKNRYTVLEPYHTSKFEGTGLGLSIVKKVMEDHGGYLLLEDAPWCEDGGKGASLIMVFPLQHDKMVEKSKLLEEL